jgi:hypothetical protein
VSVVYLADIDVHAQGRTGRLEAMVTGHDEHNVHSEDTRRRFVLQARFILIQKRCYDLANK